MKPGIYTISAAAYHDGPTEVPMLSASIINIMLNESPLHAWHAHSVLNPNYQEEQEEDDGDKKFDIGTAAHSLVLEGKDNIVELDFKDWRTNASKEAAEAAKLAGKMPLLKKNAKAVRKMADVAHKAIAECPNLCGITLAEGKPEQTLIWQEGGVWCKARLDWLHQSYKLILDFKSTQASAEPHAASKRVLDGMQAYIQAAFYLRGLKTLTGEDANFVFLNQESKRPFACSFLEATPAYLSLGADKVQTAIDMWRQCMSTGTWPGYPSKFFRPEPKPWVIDDWINRSDEMKPDYDPEYIGV